MGTENQEIQNVKKSKYVVGIRYDDKIMGTFVSFYNRVRNPRATVYLVMIGALMTALPLVNHDIALPGVVVCYVVGPILFLLGAFRDRISVHMMKKDPNLNYNEELTYRFGNTGVEVEKSGKTEYLGNYKKIFRMFEDEKHFYVNINEDDLLVLPKANFVEGDEATFREFILDKSRARFVWKPVRLDNKLKWAITRRRLARQEEQENENKDKK